MGKTKRIITSAMAVLCLLLIGLCVFYSIKNLSKKDSFTVNDTLPDGNGKKATVILLGGQSNASGCSFNEYLERNVSTQKYAEYEAGYDNVYINYYVSDRNVSGGFVKCSTRQGETESNFGPELGMAEKLNELYPDRTFFIIKCAWGGTNLYEDWLSPSSDGKTGSKYKTFVNFVKSSIKYLKAKNYDVEIEGMCWMQGESDSFSIENATDYDEHLTNFIKDIRKNFSRYAPHSGIVFVDAYIADNPMFWVYCDQVNESKKKVADSSDINLLIDTISHGLITTQEPEGAPDIPHYDSLSELKLGHLFIDSLTEFIRCD